ncbi:MAG TPA: NAD+ synthase [Candidatus Polarisedimenticolaceae bacterium]|nr:NAD+ synthase [Candidatus Polarisedimenticolaceae bacterium]
MSDGTIPEAVDGDLAIDPDWTTRILARFVASEVGRTGKRSVVVGLSGGIDSAVSAALAARALGPARVHCLLMPHRDSNPHSERDARRFAEQLGSPSETVDISPLVDGFVAVSGEVGRLRLGNVMARARMIVLFDRSAALDALVLGTSNKTELLLGYGTVHGDMASAVNPIGDLYKTQIRALAAHLDVPEAIRNKPPSADLWPDQSDEEDLGFRYDEVDRLLALLVDARIDRREAVRRGFAPGFVDGVIRQIVRSQFKRLPPVIAKVSSRSIGWDFRYPRDWLS